MNKKTASIILIVIILIGIIAAIAITNENTEVKNYSNQSTDNLSVSNNTTDNTTNNSTVQAAEVNIGTNTIHYEASGNCYKVVDGDTIWVEGVGKIRFVGVNTPERKEPGYQEAKDFVKEKCLDKTVYLDIDDKKHKDKYNRTLAIIYTDTGENLNKALLQFGYAEVMYYPPSEFPKGLGVSK